MTLSRNKYVVTPLAVILGSGGTLSNADGNATISGYVVTTTDSFTQIRLYNYGSSAGAITVNGFAFPVQSGETFAIDFEPTTTITISIAGIFSSVLLA